MKNVLNIWKKCFMFIKISKIGITQWFKSWL